MYGCERLAFAICRNGDVYTTVMRGSPERGHKQGNCGGAGARRRPAGVSTHDPRDASSAYATTLATRQLPPAGWCRRGVQCRKYAVITRRGRHRRPTERELPPASPATTLMTVYHETARRQGASGTSTRTVMIRSSVALGKRKLASLQTAFNVTSVVRGGVRRREVEGARSAAMSMELSCDDTSQPPSSPGAPQSTRPQGRRPTPAAGVGRGAKAWIHAIDDIASPARLVCVSPRAASTLASVGPHPAGGRAMHVTHGVCGVGARTAEFSMLAGRDVRRAVGTRSRLPTALACVS
jgi:hypothetical protein